MIFIVNNHLFTHATNKDLKLQKKCCQRKLIADRSAYHSSDKPNILNFDSTEHNVKGVSNENLNYYAGWGLDPR